MQLFKYMKAEHLDTTLARGIFRIGTLYEFRNMELHGAEIGDVEEGKKTIHLTAATPMTFDLLSNDPRALHTQKVMKGWDGLPAGSRIQINLNAGVSVELREESPDVYTYCASMTYDADQMRAFGYNTCIKIHDREGFFAELSNCLLDADFIVGTPVQYRPRRVDYADEGVASAVFLKSESYSSQGEFRVLWQPHTQLIAPVLVTCPRALLYCEKYDPA
jgi:hypothetical protein